MTTRGPFKLYPEARHWWSMNDYGAVLDGMAKVRAAGGATDRVLEFGPGSSTLALIEGGATYIDTCEDDPAWARTYENRLVRKFPNIVRLHRYQWTEPLAIPAVDGERYDLALIDGPLGSDRRPAVVEYCLERCAAVLLPTEDRNRRVREAIEAIAKDRGLDLDIWETGPLSGGFALLTKPRGGIDTKPQTFIGDPAGPELIVPLGDLPPAVAEAVKVEDRYSISNPIDLVNADDLGHPNTSSSDPAKAKRGRRRKSADAEKAVE